MEAGRGVYMYKGIRKGADGGGSKVKEVTRCLIEGPVSAEQEGNTLISLGLEGIEEVMRCRRVRM